MEVVVVVMVIACSQSKFKLVYQPKRQALSKSRLVYQRKRAALSSSFGSPRWLVRSPTTKTCTGAFKNHNNKASGN
jgi:hypothetical protein